VIAVALTPVLPAGLPLLAALGGLATRWGGWRDRDGWGGQGRWAGRGRRGSRRAAADIRPGRDDDAADPKELSAGGKR
jgi:hypothetical protein